MHLVHDVQGEGPTLVMLHPGGTDARSLAGLASVLAHHYRVVTPDQRGHGRTPDTDAPFSFGDMAADTIELIRGLTAPVHLFGHSDGAIVALHVVLARRDLVRSLVFSSGVTRHDAWLPGVLEGTPPDFMADAYAEVSPDGRDHWSVAVEKAAAMHRTEPAVTVEDLSSLHVPVLVVAGDDDEMPVEHLLEMYRTLPDGELAIVPRATHGHVVEKPDLLARLITGFHDPTRGNGLAPIRRPAG